MFLNKVGSLAGSLRKTRQIAAITGMLGAGASGCATQAARVTEHAMPTAARCVEAAPKAISHAANNEAIARKSGHFTADTLELGKVANNQEVFWGTLVDEALAHDVCAETAKSTCKSITAKACEGKEAAECADNIVCSMTMTSSCSASVNKGFKEKLKLLIPRFFWDILE